jgi:dihydrofolate synthase/folylpolyglutamate synthase
MVFGAMADKKSDDMLELLKPSVRQWIFTKPENARAKNPEELAGTVPQSVVCNTVTEAIRYSRQHAPKESTVLVCGSLYLVGEARARLVTQKQQ